VAGSRGRRPAKTNKTLKPSPSVSQRPSTNDEHPKFCLAFVNPEFDVKCLPTDQRADFASTLQVKGSLTWNQIAKAGRHKQGCEYLLAERFPIPPPQFADREKFMVFRYSGLRPMAGARVGDVFYILWIEREFGELYDHGGS
jgi:hypothetical protein